MAKYKPDAGAAFNAAQAQELGKLLESLGDAFTPAAVVEAARPVRSPIHALFEWNDSAAAERYRVFQARNHVNHLEIVIVIDGEETTTRAFHSITIAGEDDEAAERRYVPLRLVTANRATAEQVVAQALKELQGWKSRYEEYRRYLQPVFAAIGKVNRKRTKVA